PENVAEVSLSIQHMNVNIGDYGLRNFTFTPEASDPAMRVALWAKPIDAAGGLPDIPLRDIQLKISRLDDAKAEIEFTARTAAQPDSLVASNGHVRIVAPDSVVSRAISAIADKGWLVLPNMSGRTLTVNGNWDLRDGDLDDLAAFPQVRCVDLEGNAQLGDSGIYPLSRLPNLESVLLSGTNVSGIGMRAFRSLQRFRYIAANHTPFNDQGLLYLEGRPLTGFGGNDTRVTDEGVRSLSPGLLRSLLLAKTGVTDAAFSDFVIFPYLEILD